MEESEKILREEPPDCASIAQRSMISVLARELYNLAESENLPIAALASVFDSELMDIALQECRRNEKTPDGWASVPNVEAAARKFGLERTTLLARIRKRDAFHPAKYLERLLRVPKEARRGAPVWLDEWRSYIRGHARGKPHAHIEEGAE